MRVRIFPSISNLACVAAILYLTLGPAFPLLEASSSENPLTAESAAALAIKGNKELTAARFVLQEAQGRARGVGRLPNPELETEVAAGQNFEGRVSVGILQRFPLTDRLRLERQLSDWDLRMAELEVREQEWQITVAVRKAFVDLACAREALSISSRQAESSAALTKTVEAAVEAGFRSKLDLQEAELSAANLKAKAESLRGLEMEAAVRLNEWLGRSADTTLILHQIPSLPKSVPPHRPAGTRADLELAEMAVRSGKAHVLLSKATSWDDVGVGLFVEGERFRDDPTGIEPEALVGLKLSIPLPLWQNGSGKVSEREAAHRRMAARLEALRFAVQNQILLTYRVMGVCFRSAYEFQTKVLPAANEHVRECEAAYARGEVDLQAVFRARNRLAEIELSDLEARQAYFLAYGEWLAALGENKTNP